MPFGLGPAELMIVMVIAVLLFGKNLPSVGRSLGKSLMEFKKGLNDIKSEMDAATYAEPPTSRVADRYRADDYDEPTAPKFEPPAEQPVVQDPVAQEPVAQQPVAQQPVVQQPVVQQPVESGRPADSSTAQL